MKFLVARISWSILISVNSVIMVSFAIMMQMFCISKLPVDNSLAFGFVKKHELIKKTPANYLCQDLNWVFRVFSNYSFRKFMDNCRCLNDTIIKISYTGTLQNFLDTYHHNNIYFCYKYIKEFSPDTVELLIKLFHSFFFKREFKSLLLKTCRTSRSYSSLVWPQLATT